MSRFPWLRALVSPRRVPVRRSARPRIRLELDRLEDRTCPSITVSNLGLTPAAINEGTSATLTGDIAGRSVGDIDLAITWGDGFAVQHVSLAAGAQSFSVPHTFLDDVGTGTSNSL